MPNKINTLYNTDADFPNGLHDLFEPPNSISYMGCLPPQIPLLAVVGSRRASSYGKQSIEHLLPPLLRSNIGIISGLAFGIDKLAHMIALREEGYTAAVLPSALPKIYPSSHQLLAEHIVRGSGSIISEHRQLERIHKSHFLQRNRLIAALADAVLVIEAQERSGTISTVNHALELGREVMAVPGSIFSATSIGTNTLIKAGAHPVSSAQDIASILGIELLQPSESYTPENEQERSILAVLADDSAEFIELQMNTGIDTRELQQIISHLELKGIIKPLGSTSYALST